MLFHFTEEPTFRVLIPEKSIIYMINYNHFKKLQWGGSTNLTKTFESDFR